MKNLIFILLFGMRSLIFPQTQNFELKKGMTFSSEKYKPFFVNSLENKYRAQVAYDMDKNGEIDYLAFYDIKKGKQDKLAFGVLKLKDEISWEEFKGDPKMVFLINKEKYLVDLDRDGTLETDY